MPKFKNILHFLFPGGILFLGCCVVLYTDLWLRVESTHIDVTGGIILVIGLFLALRFDRNRLLYALSLLFIADIADRWFIAQPLFATLHHLLTLLVPINFILISLMKEKGVKSLYSMVQMSLLPIQAACVYWWIAYGNSRYYDLLATTHLPVPFNTVPDIFVIVFISALTVQITRYACHQNPVETAFVWTILCSSIAGVMQPGVEATLFRIFSALIITVSVFEMSYALAYRDELTLLPSRRALNEAFRKLGNQFSIAMADIDHFKKLNDTYGHDVGDQVLRKVAARLGRYSGGGQVYRYGGEEFCLVFPGRSREAVLEPLESLCRSIADEPFIIRQTLRPLKKPKNKRNSGKSSRSLTVTISIGVAERNSRSKSPEAVMKSADQALYRAKKGGRNRVSK